MSEPPLTPQPLGQILKQAGLLSEAQIQIALQDQAQQQDLLFGEIVVLRGWLKAQTLEFFLKHFVQTFQSLSESEVNQAASTPSGQHRMIEDLSQFYAFAPPTAERPIPAQSGSHPSGTKGSAKVGKTAPPPSQTPSPGSVAKTSTHKLSGKLHVHGFCIEAEEEDDELIEEDWSDWDLSPNPRQS